MNFLAYVSLSSFFFLLGRTIERRVWKGRLRSSDHRWYDYHEDLVDRDLKKMDDEQLK